MTILDDVGRILEATSHALAGAIEGHGDGVTGGPAAMPPVGGDPDSDYVAGLGDSGRAHVNPVSPVDRVAGGLAAPPSTASATLVMEGLVLPPNPPLLPVFSTSGTPLLPPYVSPPTPAALDSATSIETIAAAASRLVAAANKIASTSKLSITAAPVVSAVAPTVAPKVAPTVSPAVSPAVAPSTAPAVAPAATPAVAPTVSPAVSPAVPPSVAPAVAKNVATVAPAVHG